MIMTTPTKILLVPASVQVYPDFPGPIIADTGILLVMESIQRSNHSIIQLRGRKEGRRGGEEVVERRVEGRGEGRGRRRGGRWRGGERGEDRREERGMNNNGNGR